MKNLFTFVFLTLALLAIGCSSDSATSTSNVLAPSGSTSPNFDPKRIAKEEPANLISVGDARTKAEDKQEIQIVGRIGGSPDPFVEGIAAFTLIDLKLPDCAGGDCSDQGCCSADELKRNLTTVKFVGQDGRPVPVDARELLNVTSKAKVAVEGKAQRDQAGNLVVLATRLYAYPAN